MYKHLIYIVFFLSWKNSFAQEFCDRDGDKHTCLSPDSLSQSPSQFQNKRYLLYDVNPGEGFNLRRDVYMRVATLVKNLNKEAHSNWTLVLPPWGPLYHWRSKDLGFQAQIKWSKFFDLSSLSKYVPVIEFEDFLNEHGLSIDTVYYLQNYAEGWTDSGWEERADIRECIEAPRYEKLENGNYFGWFWGYEDVYATDFHCLSIQGYSSTLKSFLLSSAVSAVMIDRAEVILHDSFGNHEYWMVRHSMRFSERLISIGDNFRKFYLNSSDVQDKTVQKEDLKFVSSKRTALGGPYISVHLRRQDFAVARSSEVPSIKHAAKQILAKLKEFNLELVFVATDAPESEFKELLEFIPHAKRFTPSNEMHQNILDGGVAIVDQWICAHARYFIGTYESTFSFRIQEEREILGFPVKMTFNRLCGSNQTVCKQPSQWLIVNS